MVINPKIKRQGIWIDNLDHGRGGTAHIATGLKPGNKCVQKTKFKPLRCLCQGMKSVTHHIWHIGMGQHITAQYKVAFNKMGGFRAVFIPGPGSGFTIAIEHQQLPPLATIVGICQFITHRIGSFTGFKQGETVNPVPVVG